MIIYRYCNTLVPFIHYKWENR